MQHEMLYVVAVVSNPVGYQSRYRLFRQFMDHMATFPRVKLVVVEHAFAGRPFECTDKHNPDHIQLRGGVEYELWLKESMTNVGFRHVFERYGDAAQKLAWIDGDVHFVRPDWAEATIHALDHYAVVQPWSHSIDLGPKCEPLVNEWGNDVDRSFTLAFQMGRFEKEGDAGSVARPLRDKDDWRSHFGYAWAIHRGFYEQLPGGLIDWMVTGSADFHMCMGFSERMSEHVEKHEGSMSPGYKRRLYEFEDACKVHCRKSMASVPGTILHGFHGHKKDRGYLTRHVGINRTNFDPDVHLTQDAHGIYVWSDKAPEDLKHFLQGWFRQRNEDAT